MSVVRENLRGVVDMIFKNLFKKKKVKLPSEVIDFDEYRYTEQQFRDILNKDSVTNITEPIYTIVKKIRENPSRLRFERFLGAFGFYYDITDILTGNKITLGETFCRQRRVFSFCCSTSPFHITEEEVEYLVEQLQPLYEARAKRLVSLKKLRRGRKDSKLRIEVMKQWENS